MNNVNLELEVNARIGQELTTINLVEKGKNLPNKTISTKDFVKVLSSIKNEDEKEESPLFPSDYGTKKMLKNNNDYYFLVTTPPGRQEIEYTSLDIEHITELDNDYEENVDYGSPAFETLEDYLNGEDIYNGDGFTVNPYLPSLVWFIQVRHDVSTDTYRFIKDRIYSKEGTILSMKDNIYPAPLSNIYPENKVCWGDVEIPKLTIPGLMALQRIYFNVYSNMDLERTNATPIVIDGYEFKAKFLNLVESQRIYNNQSKEDAADFMNNVIREARPDQDKTLEGVWNDFTS